MNKVNADELTTFKNLFPVNPIRYGVYQRIEEVPGQLKKNKKAHVVPEPLTDTDLLRHLEGQFYQGVGYMPGDEDTTSTLCLDLDTKDYGDDLEALEAARNAVEITFALVVGHGVVQKKARCETLWIR